MNHDLLISSRGNINVSRIASALNWRRIVSGCLIALTWGMLMAGAALAEDDAPAGDTINPTINPNYDASESNKPRPAAKSFERLDLDLAQGSIEARVERVMAAMTIEEKLGQLSQIAVGGETLPENIADDIRAGRIGSIFYTGSAKQTREAQRIAQQESRLGLPLLTPRDVIHGFRTVFPIPLGQAASWDLELVEQAARFSATEAKAEGVNWTFAPMLDVSRDSRWGRIAESIGEDPVLGAALAAAMVTGLQGPETDDRGEPRYTGIAACAKHYVAYGLSEGGRDYNRTQVAVSELHNVHLKPFEAAIKADCLTLMTGFNSLNGVPVSGHRGLVRGVLKKKWGFRGLVVSDWTSVFEMIDHGYAADKRQAALRGFSAGVDMEMASDCYRNNLRSLLDDGDVSIGQVNDAVARILRVKFQVAMGSNSKPERDESLSSALTPESLAAARKLARESIVLLKNENQTLPLAKDSLKRIALIGPLADAARDQLGCWMLDGKPPETVTPAKALRETFGAGAEVQFVPGVESPIAPETDGVAAAVEAAQNADVAVLCVGEGWNLSGEARNRANLDLPGAQKELVRKVAATETPVVLVVMAGRPLTIGDELEAVDAALYAWHPGTMGGHAVVDLLLGMESPSGKLPVTFPKHVGQSPLYYNHPRTGRPAEPDTKALIGSGLVDFPDKQKYRSHYLDVDPFPLRPFGFGLSYTDFEYGEPEITSPTLAMGKVLGVRVPLKNVGKRAGAEVAQLYVQDVTADLVRPVRELKAFRRVQLEPGESTILEFALSADDLAYYNNEAKLVHEPGKFRLGVGGDSTAPLSVEFELRK